MWTTLVNPEKAEARRRLRVLRAGLDGQARAAASEAIRRRVLALPEVESAAAVFCYVSFRDEVETHGLIRALLAGGKTVCVPRLLGGGRMLAQPIASLSDLTPGKLGILAPREDTPAVDHPCGLAIVPGLAFTERGDRMGYGMGHYDRYLAEHPGVSTIGLCFDALLVEAFPTEPHDRRVDILVTESRLLRVRPGAAT